MRQQARYYRSSLLMVPGTLVALFAIASIVLPVGSAGLGASIQGDGTTAMLRLWARDLHDGFWRGGFEPRVLASSASAVGAERQAARHAAIRGEAERAVAGYRQLGRLDEQDCYLLFELAERLIVDGQYDRAEWYVREADALLGGGTLRNNLAWHYTQVERRAVTALTLALESVASGADACNIDTLAWAYYRNGDETLARRTAARVLLLEDRLQLDVTGWELTEAKRSSQRLLALMDGSAVSKAR